MSQLRRQRLERFMRRDSSADGRFLSGVRTTGIYCLPSCPARKPDPGNVVFFETEAEAKEAGFRACLRCRPDLFYRGEDVDREVITELAAEVRRRPAEFGSVSALVRRGGFGQTKLYALFREHFHVSPAAYLAAAQVEAARQALAGGAGISEAGHAAGFESVSGFRGRFRRVTGLTPGEYRALTGRTSFRFRLPDDFRPGAALAYHGRDPEDPTTRVRGRTLHRMLRIEGAPVLLSLRPGRGAACCRLRAEVPLPPEAARSAHALALRMLGLPSDPRPLERRAGRHPLYGPLLARRPGLRVPLAVSPFEALAWAVVGQQISLPAAWRLRRAVIELAESAGGDAASLRPHPDAAAVAALEPRDLARRGFSRMKAEYLIGVARAVAGGEPDLDGLPGLGAPAAEVRLRALRGVGPWTAQYTLLRGLGFADCAPLGDAGLRAALQRLHELADRPDEARTRHLLRPLAPYRSLGTCHLWMSLREAA